MKKLIFLLCCWVGSIIGAQAQFNTYNEYGIDRIGSDQGAGLLVDSQGVLLTTLSVYDYNSTSCMSFLKLNAQREREWLTVIPYLHFGGRYTVVKLPDDGYIGVGDVPIDENVHRLALVRLTAQGDTVWTKYHEDPYMSYARQLILLPDSTLLINTDGWSGPITGTIDKTLWNLDLEGNIIWKNRLVDTVFSAQLGNMAVTPEGDILVAAEGVVYAADPSSIKSLLTKVSASGDVKWSKELYPMTFNSSNLATGVLHNGVYAYAGHKDTFLMSSPYLAPQSAMTLHLLDTAGTILKETMLWERSFPWESINTMTIAPNDDIYVVGARRDTSSVYKGFVVKLSAAGDILWRREIADANPNFDTDISALQIGADGKLYLVGTVYKVDEQSSIGLATLITLDTSGCFNGLCDSVMVLNLQELALAVSYPTLQVYPNPATAVVTLVFDEWLTGATLLLTDVQGRAWREVAWEGKQVALPIADLPVGIYYATLRENGQLRAKGTFVKKRE